MNDRIVILIDYWVRLTREELDTLEMYRNFTRFDPAKYTTDDDAIDLLRREILPIACSSVLLTGYSHFERSLNLLCNSLEGTSEGVKELNGFKGFGIRRAKSFLCQDDLKIKSVFGSSAWNDLVQLSEVRNVITHCAGEVKLSEPKHQRILDFAIKNDAKRVDFDWGTCLVITESFIDNSFKIKSDFLSVVESACESLISREHILDSI